MIVFIYKWLKNTVFSQNLRTQRPDSLFRPLWRHFIGHSRGHLGQAQALQDEERSAQAEREERSREDDGESAQGTEVKENARF
jgi:hypothetical protein